LFAGNCSPSHEEEIMFGFTLQYRFFSFLEKEKEDEVPDPGAENISALHENLS